MGKIVLLQARLSMFAHFSIWNQIWIKRSAPTMPHQIFMTFSPYHFCNENMGIFKINTKFLESTKSTNIEAVLQKTHLWWVAHVTLLLEKRCTQDSFWLLKKPHVLQNHLLPVNNKGTFQHKFYQVNKTEAVVL